MFSVKGSIWIESNNRAFIGMGRMTLLEKIEEHGSITVAAKSMRMSYRQAWELVNSMNKQSKHPLVIASSGGAGGGGTKVTKEGKKIINIFKSMNERFHKFNEEESKKLTI